MKIWRVSFKLIFPLDGQKEFHPKYWFQKVMEHQSERNEIASLQLTDTGEFNKD